MRDIDALLRFLISVDRKSLIAILTSEAEPARYRDLDRRTAVQRATRQAARAQVSRIVLNQPIARRAAN